ncbi:hypothetical protein M0R45_038138 [Rubus argutus]|uniref:Uncharacterized protein n=1 Tax=Rubus argutus TaxID=59490 RepID=A0AAW1W441_RUBAR
MEKPQPSQHVNAHSTATTCISLGSLQHSFNSKAQPFIQPHLLNSLNSMEDTPTLPPSKSYELTASSISYTKSTTTFAPFNFLFKPCTSPPSPTYILRDVSLTAYSSQILAVVGSQRRRKVHSPRHPSRPNLPHKRLSPPQLLPPQRFLVPQNLRLRPPTRCMPPPPHRLRNLRLRRLPPHSQPQQVQYCNHRLLSSLRAQAHASHQHAPRPRPIRWRTSPRFDRPKPSP